jgi:DNA polymerase IV
MFMQKSSDPRRKEEDSTCSRRNNALYCAVDIAWFPAQVMAAYHAHLRDAPFAVICQDEHSHKSVVVSCSTAAQQRGIECGMPMHLVSRRWPDVAVVQREAALEAACCEEIAAVLYRYSPDVAVRANGAGIVNLSRTPAQRTIRPFAIGAALCRDLAAAVPLTDIAAGLGATEAVARIMARMARPSGVSVCDAGREAQTIAGLDATMLPGLSGQCRQKLVAYGLRRIGQVQKISRDALVARFGAEGERLYSVATGGTGGAATQRTLPLRALRALRAETVLENDINDMDVIIRKVRHTVDKLCFLLKNEDVQIKKFMVTIRYSDNKKSQKTVALPVLTNDFLTMVRYAQQAFTALYQRRVAIRAIVLDTKDARPDPCQTSLFETSWERKQADLARQIVKVRNENSFETVVSGAVLAPLRRSPAGGLNLKPSPSGGR